MRGHGWGGVDPARFVAALVCRDIIIRRGQAGGGGLRWLHLHLHRLGDDLDSAGNSRQLEFGSIVGGRNQARRIGISVPLYVDGLGSDVDPTRFATELVVVRGVIVRWYKAGSLGAWRVHLHVAGFGRDVDPTGFVSGLAVSGIVSGRNEVGCCHRNWNNQLHLYVDRFGRDVDVERLVAELVVIGGLLCRRNQAGRCAQWRVHLHVDGFRGDLDAARTRSWLAVRRTICRWNEVGRGGLRGWRACLRVDG